MRDRAVTGAFAIRSTIFAPLCQSRAIVGMGGVLLWKGREQRDNPLFLGRGQEYDCCRSKNMRKAFQTALWMVIVVAGAVISVF